MKTITSLLTLFFLIQFTGVAQQRSAIGIQLNRQASQTQSNLPDSTFNVFGLFEMSDTLNVSKIVVSIRDNFQDTLLPTDFLTTDTLSLNQSHTILQRS
ncbi:MAG: hypothetical protein V2I33_26225, partial [Kangiellaceae bacterium]|nr:hypothetical protein [Kangiellaceae bacterium]